MSDYQLFDVVVSEIIDLASHVKRFTLQAKDARLLPPFTGGAHIMVQINDQGKVYCNAYSLMSDPACLQYYQIAVKLADPSRGGSVWLHNKLKAGETLTISTPQNQFALAPAENHLLIAGGIGITPFISQLYDLHRENKNYQLYYCFRADENKINLSSLADMTLAKHIVYHASAEQGRLDFLALIKSQQPDTHIYVCGKNAFNESVKIAARQCQIPDSQLHFEQFAIEDKSGSAFTLILSRSGKVLEVPEDMTILQVIERHKAAKLECLCREGICGTCETTILEGEADHRDLYLSDEERAAQKTMLICCSRAKSQRLVLDL